MIPELGHFALILALLVSVVQSTVPMLGTLRNDAAWMEVARPAALTGFLLVALAFGALMHAYIVSDFSVVNVAQNSHSLKPLIYKISGVWGNHEGSLLLWVLILTLFAAAVAAFGDNLPMGLRTRVVAVQGMVTSGFLLFILATSNPFLRLDPAPIDGNDLNPLLQDPGLALHPPFLYLGYVGFSIAFSFAVAALIEGRVDPAWARWVRPWTLAAWVFLTIGIALGSWWAYYTLGWGGWWFWDPVENASLLPWLAGTALLHSAIVVEKRDALKSWTILLAILAFSLSLVGTFLVRSGILTSVHAFAVDPERGVFILLLLAVAIGGSLTLFALRAPAMKAGGLFAPVSREGALVLNNLLLTTATATVLIGTLYPLFLEVLDAGKVSVGAPFFNATFIPLMIPLVAAMAVAPLMAWKRGDLVGVLGRMTVATVLTVACVLWALYEHSGGPVMALVGIAMACWAIFGALTDLAERIRLFRVPLGDSLRRAGGLSRATWGGVLAHAGVGIAIAGMTGSGGWMSERILTMAPGDQVQIAGYTVTLESVAPIAGPNYRADRATIRITNGNRLVGEMHPERRRFLVSGDLITNSAIRTNLLADLYVALGDPVEDSQAWTIRLYHHPLVPWIWIGCLVMAIGGTISLTDRRLRIGVPARSKALGAATRSLSGTATATPSRPAS